MPFMQWMPRLEVGVKVLDAQHQGLFASINRLWDAYQNEDERELKAVLGALMDYAERHFHDEEELMESSAYDAGEQHRAQHMEFKAKVRQMEWRREVAPHSVGLELLEYLRDWLVQHIAQEDRKLGAWLASKGIG